MAFALARYNVDGSLDESFGSGGGIIMTDIAWPGDEAFALALDPFGRIVAAGSAPTGADTTRTKVALVRYNVDGRLDYAFGSFGKVSTPFGLSSGAHGITHDGFGRIIVAGFVAGAEDITSPFGNFALARYGSNGTLDPSFGDEGKVFTNFPSASDELARAIAIDGVGRIVVAGVAKVEGAEQFAVASYTSGGSLRASFGDDGRVLTVFPAAATAQATSIAIDGVGRIVVAGVAKVEGAARFAVARYHPNGNLDASFGDGGRVLTTFLSAEDAEARAVTIDGFGRIVAAGVAGLEGGTQSRFALARYNDDGSLDRSFDGDGKVLTNFLPTPTEAATGIAIDGFGRIVAAGTAVEGGITLTQGLFALARYNDDGSLDRSFDGDGKLLTPLTDSRTTRARAIVIDALSRIVVAGFATGMHAEDL